MTDTLPRWTVEELISRYALEDDIRDVFVEGVSDQVLLDRAFGRKAVGHIVAYPIDAVDVPDADVVANGFEVGAKGRVLALALALLQKAPVEVDGKVVCLADTDLDDLLGRRVQCSLVLYTAKASLDAAVISEEGVRLILDNQLAINGVDAGTLLTSFAQVCAARFCQRAAFKAMGISEQQLALRKLLSHDSGAVDFDSTEYLHRILHMGGVFDRAAECADQVAALTAQIGADTTRSIHIDDFAEVLHYWSSWKRKDRTPPFDQMRSFLFFVLLATDLGELPEVQELLVRLPK